LAKVVKAAISIFTGPQVEQSFSVMNNVISGTTNRMDISTYSAMQSVKYNLSAKHTTSLKSYHRDDILKTPVDKSVVYHVSTAYGRYKRKLDTQKLAKEQTAKTLKLDKRTKTARNVDSLHMLNL
jgi:hypothetical protein